MSFKRAKVVMLPTNEKAPFSDIILAKKYNLLHHTKHYGKAWTDMGDVYQHLYFLSDDEIKEGDWCINLTHKLVVKPTDIEWSNSNKDNLKKIIATTNTSLLIGGPKSKNWVYLPFPQPSEGFIQKFIESYDDGNPITEVDVEYETETWGVDGIFHKLKVNPKDNTITIKKVKDTWTRDEVVKLLEEVRWQSIGNPTEFTKNFSKWIEENL